MSPAVQAALRRLWWSLLISSIFAFVVSEVSYQLVKDRSERPPQTVEILIPAGTAAKIANGDEGPTLPEMRFVEGDTLLVRNLDEVSHQLGPLWVLPGSSSRLTLDRPSQYTMECSFQQSRSLGIDVLPRAKTSDRIFGIISVGFPTWILLWLYWLVAKPLSGSENEKMLSEAG
ncbi:hypothetical protein BECAL_01263 [Bellilinea caldifistulae]|uniref:Uncharacterized protein n=1 Tax=Bellilinea caldifistulae TaxID=360411 RepID=A0A0P6X2Z6_9CHLR|nr:hypothetical protein [Bellilinea caldifistulae]KPL77147.1 hypothetical protein AC812_04025 [Bellilinea caldifistulae]GAP10105.1 hypothetical protein BECAL_01263 [Bellilinea caldifistulae]